MILDLPEPRRCSKPQCARTDIHRHHRGCEAMWLRHFRHKRRSKRFQEFRLRYYEYRKEDCVEICAWHHAEIHSVYIRIISAAVTSIAAERGTPTKCSSWSWLEAEALMERLREECQQWLGTTTAGSDPNRKREFHNENT